jgi:hypothetical protein
MAVVASISQQIWDMSYRIHELSSEPLFVALPLNYPAESTHTVGSPVGLLAFGGAFVTVGAWAARKFFRIEIPAELAAPLTTIVVAICWEIQTFASFMSQFVIH